MWNFFFNNMMSRLIRQGGAKVTFPDGHSTRYGPDSPTVAFKIHDQATLRALCLTPELALGEAYMDARLTIEGDDLDALIRLLVGNLHKSAMPLWVRAMDRTNYHLRRIIQRNTADSAKSNVAHHYDISDELYGLFLDDDMQYSCAYFSDPAMTLEQAQAAKKAHIAAKLQINDGDHVLDIGCGWGGMALTLARDYGARVTGVTLSENQLATARARATAAGLDGQVTFELRDYRDLSQQFDRIVSVGMLEHVGVPHYGDYFSKVSDLLAPDGIALIHTIGRSAPPMAHSPWIHKYIFPGGYVPSLSELAPAIENAGLWQCDIEIWRLHYAMTLRHWLARFDANLPKIRSLYDDRFIRMFRYYLTICIIAFEVQHQAVYHFQLAHKRDAVPLTRNYLYPADKQPIKRAAE